MQRNTQIKPDVLVEEETLRQYRADRYYPVNIGDVFRDQYKIIAKLGFGSASTVWLCKNQEDHGSYAALKVYVNSSKFHRELPIYEHISSLKSEHEGENHVRRLLDSFEVIGPNGKHICLVHEPLGMSFNDLRRLIPTKVFDEELLRQTMRPIIKGLQFLHGEAGVIHTDLQPNNMLMGVVDDSPFRRIEIDEANDPLPRKQLSDRTIHVSRHMPLTNGAPSITDLSEARFGDSLHSDLIMPNVYRAPEVILNMPWSYPVDIWAIAISVWDLFEPSRLFKAKGAEGEYSEHHHLAQMIAIMGPPPRDFLKRSERCDRFWRADGSWKGEVPIPELSLEGSEQRLKGKSQEMFLAWIRQMLQWRPEDRSNCEDIFHDEWLLADLIESGEVVPAE
ncbi:hypothetical protein KVT40_006199 [Elsinoe batatas]|uniref:non-specific serine/threonine protein kinase n=1 Tax=Elsinoe batatas TaxID=2601811 RepID=A0A8K0PFZ0_9PEZI|nr:hypothetical protein KVT40_006199 [Elsinoe batatas]